MRHEVDRSAMIRLFEEIREAFPQLSMRLDHDPANVDLNMDIPEQPGLTFDMNLNLQGDELHLTAGAFWLEWFPCTRPDVVQAYREAVHGLLSGMYRIRERHRGRRPFKAELQKPDQGGWQTIGTWYGWAWPFPRRSVEKIVQNVTSSSSST
jgi:hypothetical protein